MKTPDQLFHGSGSKEQPLEPTLEHHLASLLHGPDGTSGILSRIDAAPDIKSLTDLKELPAIGLRDSQALFLFGDSTALEKGLDFTTTIIARMKERSKQLGQPIEKIPFATWQNSLPFLRAAVHAQAVVPDLARELANPIESKDLSAYKDLLKQLDSSFNLFTGRVLAARVRAFLAKHALEQTLDEQPISYVLESNDIQIPSITEFEDIDVSNIRDPKLLAWIEEEFKWLKKECDLVTQKRAFLFDAISSLPKTINPDTEPEKYAEYVNALARFTHYTDRYFRFNLESARMGFVV